MNRLFILLLTSLSLSAAAIPEQLDIRANHQPLIEVLESIAKQCGAGIVVQQSVQKKVDWEATINARKTTWPDASRWLADEFRLTMRLNGEHLEIGDADAEFRARLVSKIYDLRTLTQTMASFPGPTLDIPEPGGVSARLLPPIEAESIPEINDFIELVENRVAPNTWQIEGVSIEEFNGSMVITQVPEIQKQIAEFVATLERVAARQVIVRCYHVPPATINNKALTVIDAADWTPVVTILGNPIGVFQLLDEQQNHHFSGKQSAFIMDADVNQESYDPIVTVLSAGLSIDVQANVTHAGVVAGVRFNAASEHIITKANITTTQGIVITPIDLTTNTLDRSRDTRIIPDGGAAIYRFQDRVYALHFEVIDFSK